MAMTEEQFALRAAAATAIAEAVAHKETAAAGTRAPVMETMEANVVQAEIAVMAGELAAEAVVAGWAEVDTTSAVPLKTRPRLRRQWWRRCRRKQPPQSRQLFSYSRGGSHGGGADGVDGADGG